MRKIWRLGIPGILVLPLLATVYGGWATITLEDLPDYFVAQQPVDLAFTVRQHGHTRLSGLKPSVEARSGDQVVTVNAAPDHEEGRYVARLTLPAAGEWTIAINSSFGASRVTLLPVTALEQGRRPPMTLAQTERGRRLFVAKGCVTCHVHGAVRQQNGFADEIGPNLTERRFPAEYLAQFLANPSMVQPRRGSMGMPNLNLKQTEIASLTAFINAGEAHAQR
jgi:mono/diheme cytochrome c family protein